MPRNLQKLKQTFRMDYPLEKTLRRHVIYRTATAMELWRDLNAPPNI